MLTNPSSGRRMTGRIMVLATVAVALPLTATRAINYIDTPATPVAPTPVATAQAAAVQPVPPVPPLDPVAFQNIREDDKLMINGREKEWKDFTPEEKAEVRRSIAHAKEELARTRIDRAEIEREIREAMAEAQIDKEEVQRDLAEARADIDEAMREIDSHAAELRRAGQDPEQIKATVRASLKAVEAIDVEAITRHALASVDEEAIAASVAAAEASVAKAQADIERLERQFEKDE